MQRTMIFFCGALSLTTVKNVRVEEINEDNENWGVDYIHKYFG